MRRDILIGLGLGLSMSAAKGQDLKVANIRCEYRVDPAGIEQAAPMLSWELASSGRGMLQKAYRVLVSGDSSALLSDAGSVWDSKRVVSDESIRVRYQGRLLRSGGTYYWKVMVWDNKGDSSRWSGIGRWQMGLPEKQDWKGAQWIGYEAMPDSALRLPALANKAGRFRDTLPIFRKEINVTRTLKRATAFISGLGHFEMTLNGQKVGDHFLDPGWTTYSKVAMYVPFDLTPQLRRGVNAIGIMLGNGFYYLPGERYHKLIVAFGYPKLIARIVLEYEDGSVDNIYSDTTWKTSPGPLTYSSIYGGEDYDARRVQTGWDMPGFRDVGWRQSVIVSGPPLLKAQSEEPLKVFEKFAPGSVVHRGADTLVYDLGQNASGIVELQVLGVRGKQVRIVPAELLTAAGAANQDATGKPYYFEYTLSGDGAVETWHPRFSYYGFRYLQVEGAVAEGQPNPSGLPVIVGLKGLHTRNAAERDGHFSCSSELFRRTDTLIDWAVQSNLASVLTDCPHREKLGWLEEAHLMGSALRYNYNIATMYRKIIHDMMDAQTESGLIPEIAPELTQFYEPFRDSPEWASSSILVPWYLYQWYGDRETLEESYPMMGRYLAYLSTKAEGHLLYQGLGDWYDLGPKDPGVSQLTPRGLTASAIYYYDCRIVSQIAALIGKSGDAKRYADTAAVIRKAFNKKFFDPVTKQYGSGSQTANAMAVYMGLVEPRDKAAVVENIVKDVRLHNNSLTAGDIGYRYLLKVLDNEGRSDVIFDMNSRNDVPGYGYQLAKGATALTESWAALTSVSNNHFMLGHIMEWFYTGLAGIRDLESKPGFRRVVLRPEIVGDIQWAGADYHSPYGMIASHWQLRDKVFDWHVSIPGNTSATVYLPITKDCVVTEGGKTLAARKDIAVVGRQQGRLILQAGSGDYHFMVKGER